MMSVPQTSASNMGVGPSQTMESKLPHEIRTLKHSERLNFALQIGRQAGQTILAVKQSKNLQIQIKDDNTPVTEADKASNQVICESLNQAYPKDGILSEETITGEKGLNDAIINGVDAKYTWVIDPLDGTKAFIKSIYPNALDLDSRYQGKHYGVHIGLLEEGTPILGVNYYPEIDTLYFALDGFAYKQIGNAQAEPIINQHVTGIKPIVNPTEAEWAIVSKIYKELLGEEETLKLHEQGLFIEGFGYRMISIALGNECNLFISPAKKAGFWDVCSMVPFVKAAGGQVTDWEGKPINFRDMSQKGLLPNGVIISIGSNLHEKIINFIAKSTDSHGI